MARRNSLTRDQEVALATAGTEIPDGTGRRVKNGAVISAPDLANTAATSARNAELAAATGPRPLGGYDGDAARAAEAARLDPRSNPNLRPPAVLTPKQFAEDAAKQRLLSTAGLVPGRNITPETLAKATPAQIAGELAGQADFLKLAPAAAELTAKATEQAAIGKAVGMTPGITPPSTFPAAPADAPAPMPAPRGAAVATPMPGRPVPAAPVAPGADAMPPLDDPGMTYLRAGGRNVQTAATLNNIGRKNAPSRVGQTQVIDGVTYVYTQDGNLSPLAKDKADKPAVQTVQIGGKTYSVGPGGQYFDAQGEPVDFSREKPMSATDWIISGNKAEDYATYRSQFSRATGQGAAGAAMAATAAPAAPDLSKPITPDQAAKLPKGTRFVGQNGKTYVKN